VKTLWLGVVGVVVLTVQLSAQTYYVSTTGDDANAGTLESPFRTITKALSVATTPGTTIYVRGGTYAHTSTISISRSGTGDTMYKLFAYPGERPLLDFSAMPVGSSNRGIRLSGSYWHIKGFDVWKAGDNGMNVSGSNNVIEFCSFSENADTGLQLDNGASNNQVINCDSYYNADPDQEDADGFAPKLTVGSGNYFYGCRAWQNSDDGWDGYLRGADNMTTTLENCWCFMNGYLKSGAVSSGNGNGYKMGGSDDRLLRHDMVLKRCLAFDNKVKGFDQNNNKGSMTLYNCTGYRNATNYSISQALAAGETLAVKNCASLGSYGSIGAFAIQQTNSWMPPFVVTEGDFVSVDTTGVRGERNADGSLPSITFMHLAQGSDLIDAGTDVGLPFNGATPDVGCFESEPPLPVQLASFTGAMVDEHTVRLEWTTLGEVNNYGFIVQRRMITEQAFVGLPNGFVPGHGTTNVPQHYRLTDNTAGRGTWFYRLKQIDLDNTAHYTDPIRIDIVTDVNVHEPIDFSLSQNYPNPFNPSTKIEFSVATTERTLLEVYDVLGQRVTTLFDGVAQSGQLYTVAFDAWNLGGGMYFYRLQNGNRSDMKKLLLLK
jgi:hypothetical protein